MTNEVELVVELPREIWEMILSHLDMESSKEAALVSPTMYERVCYSQKNKRQCLDFWRGVS